MKIAINPPIYLKTAIVLAFLAAAPSPTLACSWLFLNQAVVDKSPQAIELKKLQETIRKQRSVIKAESKRMPKSEKENLDRHWVGRNLNARTIATPIHRLVQISKEISFSAEQTFVDLGSGTGEPGLVFAILNPDLQITGYEINRAKVDGANSVAARLGLNQARFQQQDLSDPSFALPDADYYYFFNPAYRPIISLLAQKIRLHAIDPSSTRQHRVLLYGGDSRDGIWTPAVFRQYGFKPANGYDTGRLQRLKMQVFEFAP